MEDMVQFRVNLVHTILRSLTPATLELSEECQNEKT
jgi:hypothetical protein